jgi:hypothetical protein
MRRYGIRCHPSCSRLSRNALLFGEKGCPDRLSLWVSSRCFSYILMIIDIPSSDTRVLLCSTNGGKAFPMTENHHADTHLEATRLRRMMGSSLITDSFGESRYVLILLQSLSLTIIRWMGALANTRGSGPLLSYLLHES